MTVYLSSPNNQQQAEHAAGMPVLLSYAVVGRSTWLDRGYQQAFRRILIDSGAYSEMNSGRKIDGEAYKDWWPQWSPHADAIAGLDDIRGNWKLSLKNYERFGGFPTIHDSDPQDLLKDLIPISYAQGKRWLGIGLVPPRGGKEEFVRWVCDNVPDDIHVHGFALRRYAHVRRIDSFDSNNWWQDAMKLRKHPELSHLHFGECLEIVVKRYKREKRKIANDMGSATGGIRF